MSRIDDLIRDLCPDGVEYRTIGSLGQWRGGGTPSKSRPEFWENGTIPWVSPKDMGSYELASTQDKITLQATRESSANLVPGPSLAVVSRSSILQHTLPVSIVPFEASFNQDTKTLTPHKNVNLNYAAHVLRAHANSILATTSKRGGSVNSLILPKFLEYKVPIPPLPIQEEIVRTLSNFAHLATRLEMELKAELEARRQQYSHFANSATHSEHTITLGSVATFDYGLTAKAKNAGTHRFIRITDISPNGHLLPNNAKYVDITPDSNRFIVNDRDILVARTGASYGKTFLVRSEIPMSFASYLIRINLNPLQVDPEIYWHFTHSRDYWKQAASLVSKGGQQQFNSNALKRIKIPIPPLTQQREIAKSLNHLSSLAHDLTSGLPAEIEARRKQYEYYRDRLLTFPEKK